MFDDVEVIREIQLDGVHLMLLLTITLVCRDNGGVGDGDDGGDNDGDDGDDDAGEIFKKGGAHTKHSHQVKPTPFPLLFLILLSFIFFHLSVEPMAVLAVPQSLVKGHAARSQVSANQSRGHVQRRKMGLDLG